MDSYENDVIENENSFSGDSMAQAEADVDTTPGTSDEQFGSHPMPEPVDTSVEGLPLPESMPKEEPYPANPDAEAAQANLPEDAAIPISEQKNPPQAEMPKQESTIICPRCRNVVPNQNFCPACAFSLRGLPPAQPRPKPPVTPYGVPPIAVTGQPPYPPVYQPVYRPQPPVTPVAPPVPPTMPVNQHWQQSAMPPVQPSVQVPPKAPIPPQAPPPLPPQNNIPASIGYIPPSPPPYGAYVPQYHKPQRSGHGLAIAGIILGSFIALCVFLVTLFTILIYSDLHEWIGWDDSTYPDSYGNSDEYIPPYGDGSDEQQNYTLPQHFVGDTVSSDDIAYDFNSSRIEQKEGTKYIVIGITVHNDSNNTFTLKPSLFRLEDVSGGAYQYYGKPDTFHNPLEQVVLMPGEKTTKDLTYIFTGGEDDDYIPLYIMDTKGNDLFFVYMQLYS